MTTKIRKSRAARTVKSLPPKALSAKSATGVKGGFEAVEHGAAQKKDYIKFKLVEPFISSH